MAGNASTPHNYITVKLAFEVTVAADARRATRDTSFRITRPRSMPGLRVIIRIAWRRPRIPARLSVGL